MNPIAEASKSKGVPDSCVAIAYLMMIVKNVQENINVCSTTKHYEAHEIAGVNDLRYRISLHYISLVSESDVGQ